MQSRLCVTQSHESDHSAFKQPETLISKGAKMLSKEKTGQDDDGKHRLSKKGENSRIDVVHDRKEQSGGESRSTDKLEGRGAENDSRTNNQKITNNNNQEQARQAQMKPKLSFSVDSIMSSKSSHDRDSHAHGSHSVYTEHTSSPERRENNDNHSDIESDSENVDIENVDSDSEDERQSYLDKHSDRPPEDDKSRSVDELSLRNEEGFHRLKDHHADRDVPTHGTFSVDGLLRSPGAGRMEELHRPPVPSFIGAVSPVEMARWSQLAFPSVPGLSSPSCMNHSKYK